MRYTAAHSTSCCGAHSYSGFGRNENNDPAIINQTMQQGPVGRLADITLNRNQITQNPVMMQRLADLGFVLDAHWINSVHNSDVYRFTRCDRRRPLLAGIENHWNGMIMTAGLNGDLPAVPNIAPQGANAPARVGRLAIQPGDRVRVINQASRRHNREFVVEDCPRDGYDMIARMRDDREGNAMFRLSFESLQLVQAAGARPAAPVVAQRHQEAQVALAAADRVIERVVERVVEVPAAPAPAEIRVGDRVRFLDPNNRRRRPVGTEGTVLEIPRHGHYRIDWAVVPHNINESNRRGEIELVQARAPAVEARVVGRYWHCVFRDGRRGAGYQTFAEANRNLGRRTRIDRFEILSDSTTRWVESVRD